MENRILYVIIGLLIGYIIYLNVKPTKVEYVQGASAIITDTVKTKTDTTYLIKHKYLTRVDTVVKIDTAFIVVDFLDTKRHYDRCYDFDLQGSKLQVSYSGDVQYNALLHDTAFISDYTFTNREQSKKMNNLFGGFTYSSHPSGVSVALTYRLKNIEAYGSRSLNTNSWTAGVLWRLK